MRVFVAGLMHETNSFSPIATTRASFAEACLVRPSGMPGDAACLASLAAYPGYGEFLREAARRGDEIVCGPAYFAMPSAPAPAGLYAAFKAAILEDLAAAPRPDIVLLALHGAQLAEGCDDCAGDLAAAARAQAGARTPIGVLLDLHGFVSDRLLAAADICLACKEYPHDDFDARAVRLYDLIARQAAGGIRPTQARIRVPMLAMHHPSRPPMRTLVDETNRVEEAGDALAVSLMHGFPWADTAHGGASVVVATNRDEAAAGRIARRFAEAFFAQRGDVRGRLLDPDAALQRAAGGQPPVVIAETSDNPGGGCGSDATALLHALRARGAQRAGCAIVWDERAIAQARQAGVGAVYDGAIGGRSGPFAGSPFEGRIRVLALADDVRQGGFFERTGTPMGAAALEIDGVVVIVSGRRQQCVHPDAFTQFGVDPSALDIIVVKSSQHFHKGFAPIAGDILYCDAPGPLSQDFASFPYRHIARPIWPLDPIDRL